MSNLILDGLICPCLKCAVPYERIIQYSRENSWEHNAHICIRLPPGARRLLFSLASADASTVYP
jgi:hypothetical protein